MTLEKHLVVFAKAPRLGRVKSRLARDIGPVAAWAYYRRQLAETSRCLAGAGRWRGWLAVTPDQAVFRDRPWPDHWDRISQGSGDLGQRMDRIMTVLPPGPVVIVGSDIPGIRPDQIKAAFRRLGDHDAVLGPAPDGGYWLVGLRRRPRLPRAFDNVRWSTPHAMADTLANLANHRTVLLDEMEDVDDGLSFARWRLNRRFRQAR